MGCGKTKFVTGLQKIGHVGTNYSTPHHITEHISVLHGIEYLHSITIIRKPMKFLTILKIMWL